MVSQHEAHSLDVFPFGVVNGELHVAVADPFDPELHALLRKLPVSVVHLTLGVPSHLRTRVNQTYRALSAVTTDIAAFNASDVSRSSTPRRSSAAAAAIVDDAPIVQVVNKIVTQALRDRASDVHIEPADDERARPLPHRRRAAGGRRAAGRDGPGAREPHQDHGGHEHRRAAASAGRPVRDEHRRPRPRRARLDHLDDLGREDGAAVARPHPLAVPARASSACRRRSSALYSRIVQSPFGMVIVGGPTGSGKTTTLYATLSEINRPDINVMTIEDPVEYIFPQVNQIQISEQAGMTFATGLKSILRQDPDVILVGEVRDVETARIAVQSALTGHLVFSSVHAIDSVSPLYRLLDMGIEPFLVTSAIVGVVAQRLVRRICASCATPYEPTLADVDAVPRSSAAREKHAWLRGTGCQFCSRHRLLRPRRRLRGARASPTSCASASSTGSRRASRASSRSQQGLRTLQAEAIALVEHDITTMDEVVQARRSSRRTLE